MAAPILGAVTVGGERADRPCWPALHLAVRRATVSLRIGWICLLVVGAAILIFGLVAALAPTSGDPLLMRADGLASIGLGLFGVLIAAFPFRRRERWAWC